MEARPLAALFRLSGPLRHSTRGSHALPCPGARCRCRFDLLKTARHDEARATDMPARRDGLPSDVPAAADDAGICGAARSCPPAMALLRAPSGLHHRRPSQRLSRRPPGRPPGIAPRKGGRPQERPVTRINMSRPAARMRDLGSDKYSDGNCHHSMRSRNP